MKDHNVIPRNFHRLSVTAMCGANKGHRFIVTKDWSGYHGYDIDNGMTYQMFADHLRNPNFFRLDAVEVKA